MNKKVCNGCETKSRCRGHEIYFDRRRREWLFSEDGQSVKENHLTRSCKHCGRNNTPEGHDGCLGTLLGVMNACCGHGLDNEAYIQFNTGKILRGNSAILAFGQMGFDFDKIFGRKI